MNKRHRRQPPRNPRGITTTGLIIILSLCGVVAAGAFYVTPRYLLAQPGSEGVSEAIPATVPAHQEFMDILARLIGRSRAVIAVHHRPSNPFTDLVLWLEDLENPGRMDLSEIALLTHSKTVQTLTLVRLSPTKPQDDPLGALVNIDETGAEKIWNLPPETDAAPEPDSPLFPGFLRRHPRAESTIIGAGLSDLTYSLQPAESPSSRDLLGISLTWSADSVDGSDACSKSVHVVLR